MARLKITIEGEMSPEEVKRYIVAAWANLPHEVAVSEFETDGPQPVPVKIAAPEPVAVPVVQMPVAVVEAPEPTPQPEAPPQEQSMADRLNQHKKLSQLILELQNAGYVELPAIVAACQNLQSQVPLLLRLGERLEDRITRTYEGM